MWHAGGEDDLLIPKVPKTFDLEIQLRGTDSITIPIALAAQRAKARSGTVMATRSDRSVGGLLEWD